VSPAYRSDIDGLRAIAILLVVGFHAFPHQVGGGFIGVDIFFVISGFLITGLISGALADGRWSLADFYLRRMRRLFPALLTVLLACMVFGWVTLFPADYSNLGRDIGAGAGFIANLVLLHSAGYFDTASELKPLLHLWSLGVEEQFYIIWPLTIAIVWRWRRTPLCMAIALLVVSFAWNVVLTRTNPLAAFFLPVTRFWELMLGCVLALLTLTGSHAPVPTSGGTNQSPRRYESPAMQELAAWAGVSLIVAATVFIRPTSNFPGWWALLPTLGAALLIFAGKTTSINRWLGHPALVYIGLISYPLYLWHWPILAYLRILRFSEPTALMKFGAICLAFILAHLTYRFIERPIRFGTRGPFRPIAVSAALAVTGMFGLLIYAHHGIPSRFPANIQMLVRDFAGEARINRTDTCLVKTFSTIDAGNETNNKRRRIVLWGDSHAEHLVPGLCELERRHHASRLVLHTLGGCPPIFSFNSEMVPNCSTTNQTVGHAIETEKPDTLILAANWDYYDGATPWGRIAEGSIENTIKRMRQIGIDHIVVVGQMPIWFASPAKILARFHRVLGIMSFTSDPAPVPDRTLRYLRSSFFSADRTMGSISSKMGVDFVSPPATFCNRDGCLLVVPDPNGEPTMFDTNHLTRAGSVFFATSNERALTRR
jgi:peptidoglycan/LPS O-acetylase OafA/YrhL